MALTKIIEAGRGHLEAAGESYGQHLRFAMSVGAMLVAAGIACMLHALVPGVCRNTASRTVGWLQRVIADRSQLAEAQRQTMEAVAFALLAGMAVVVGAALWASGAHALPTIALTVLALSIPATLLATNPDLEAEAGEPA